MPLNFTAIDFETANSFIGSACAVGLVKVRDGAIVAEQKMLIQPSGKQRHFDPRNIDLHGITADDVADAPRFSAVLPMILDFVDGDAVVAHNIGFDAAVLHLAAEASGVSVPTLDCACTLALARKSYDLPSYSLPFVADAAGADLVCHHDPIDDARACAHILIDIARRQGTESVHQLNDALGVTPRAWVRTPRITHLEWDRPDRSPDPHVAEGVNPKPNPHADASNPLSGQRIAFSGRLAQRRVAAKEVAAECGAQPCDIVDRTCTMLVVGEGFIAHDLRERDFSRTQLSAKVKRALELRRSGFALDIISETEFLGLTVLGSQRSAH